MKGKGTFLYRDMDHEEVIDKLLAGNFQRLDLKVADGPWVSPIWDEPEFIARVQSHGIDVWGYGFNYGQLPHREGERAAERVLSLGLDGYIWNVEGFFERWTNCPDRADQMLNAYEASGGNKPTALCTWPLFHNPKTGSDWHRQDLAERLMRRCQYAMPMCYWGFYGDTARSAVEWLQWAVAQWRQFTEKPIIPVGRAYIDGWETRLELRPDAVVDFEQEVRRLELAGISWWEMGWTTKFEPEIWDIISAMSPWDFAPPTDLGMQVRAEATKIRILADEYMEISHILESIAEKLT